MYVFRSHPPSPSETISFSIPTRPRPDDGPPGLLIESIIPRLGSGARCYLGVCIAETGLSPASRKKAAVQRSSGLAHMHSSLPSPVRYYSLLG